MSVLTKQKTLSFTEILELNLNKDDLDGTLFILKRNHYIFGDVYLKLDGTLSHAKLGAIDIACFDLETAFKNSINFNLEIVKKPDDWKFVSMENL